MHQICNRSLNLLWQKARVLSCLLNFGMSRLNYNISTYANGSDDDPTDYGFEDGTLQKYINEIEIFNI